MNLLHRGLPPRVRGNRPPTGVRVNGIRPTPARAGQPRAPPGASGLQSAYPRACGATTVDLADLPDDCGLPPRVRGNHGRARVRQDFGGPTPARAGQPGARHVHLPSRRAYPRACGATAAACAAAGEPGGLPPRVRGNHGDHVPAKLPLGPTPARAGQPGGALQHHAVPAAYPRACGATRQIRQTAFDGTGLPPRVRGNLDVLQHPRPDRGPTPARAGQPISASALSSVTPAYPRACGATRYQLRARLAEDGLPPRVRGNRAGRPRRAHGHRPTPARAGQPARHAHKRRDREAYPRACGATSPAVGRRSICTGLPPRVRGNRGRALARDVCRGPTPARAGQPIFDMIPPAASPAYPRACGATAHEHPDAFAARGLPPRVRGNRLDEQLDRAQVGPTPARAGQPPYLSIGTWTCTAYPRACGATTHECGRNCDA